MGFSYLFSFFFFSLISIMISWLYVCIYIHFLFRLLLFGIMNSTNGGFLFISFPLEEKCQITLSLLLFFSLQ